MPHYNRQGNIPSKRHTQFRNPSGELFAEQLFSTEGFSNDYSLLYHVHPPTRIIHTGKPTDERPAAVSAQSLKHLCFDSFKSPVADHDTKSRIPLLFNNDCIISVAAPSDNFTNSFYKNADADEVIFVHVGSGVLHTLYGDIPFTYGDYLVIPRGTVYQISFSDNTNRLLIIESFSPIRYPKRYLSKYGQLLEHAPYCERDIRTPILSTTVIENGEFNILTKKKGMLYPITYAHHPFDVVGWDGCCYPYAFSIHDFEPVTGRIHQPPPVHQTFEANNFVICSFVPRLYDYHPNAIPAPYNHSNIDSDEVLYYVDGDFMSRKHVERGMITLHPSGIPHGPHPGAVEKSIGKTTTQELAVMIDTFHPLWVTAEAMSSEVKGYSESWIV